MGLREGTNKNTRSQILSTTDIRTTPLIAYEKRISDRPLENVIDFHLETLKHKPRKLVQVTRQS